MTSYLTRTATDSELDSVIALCLEAFIDEAVVAWVVPDSAERARYLRELFTQSLDAAVNAGALTLAVDDDGVPVAAAIWMPRTAESDRQDAPGTHPQHRSDHQDQLDDQRADRHGRHAERRATATESTDLAALRVAAVEEATRARQPIAPHLHLSAMATLPSHRGQGAGAALLAACLADARQLSLPVYLEASTRDNRRLYERSGFTDLGEPITLPDGGPALQPMWHPAG